MSTCLQAFDVQKYYKFSVNLLGYGDDEVPNHQSMVLIFFQNGLYKCMGCHICWFDNVFYSGMIGLLFKQILGFP